MKKIILLATFCSAFFVGNANYVSPTQQSVSVVNVQADPEQEFMDALKQLKEGDCLIATMENGVYKFVIKPSCGGSTTGLIRCGGQDPDLFWKCVNAAIDSYGCQHITWKGDNWTSRDCSN